MPYSTRRSSSSASVGTVPASHRVGRLRVIAGLAVGMATSLGGVAFGDVSPAAGMMRWPDVSKDRICFVYANDIWVAPKAGGQAQPLASPPGLEQFPRFAGDGATIAFVGNYDGNRDVYTMPVAGGVPARVTHHPGGETLADWTPDGKLLFMSNGFAGLSRMTQLWTVGSTGGLPEILPVPYAGFGAISPSGEWLAYTPHSIDNRTWKRYRGGMATDIWLFNLKNNQARKITEWEGTDTLPMWVPGGRGDKVYYLSDNGPEHRLNIWSFDVGSGVRAQVTNFREDDVRWPSIGPGDNGEGEIVFQLGEELMLLNLGSGQSRVVQVTIPGARPRLRERVVDASDYVTGASISPGAKRVAIEARGDLWSAPAKEGVVRNWTRTDGVAERDPSWSPDGKWIAYFSDQSGEYELWVRASDARPPEKKEDKKEEGTKAEGAQEEEKKDDVVKAEGTEASNAAMPEPRKLTSLGAGFRFSPVWSPDSKKIVFTDANGRLYLTDVASGETKEIDKDPWMESPSVSWSHDSRWLAYSRSDEGNSQGVIWIMNIVSGEKKAITSAMFSSGSPAFDRKGDFIFFSSNRDIENPTYGDLDTTFVYTGTELLYQVPLRSDVKNPWLPKSDEETFKEDKKDEKKDDAKKNDAKDEKKDETKEGTEAAATADDGVTGTWEGSSKFNSPPEGMPPEMPFTLTVRLKDGAISGRITSAMGGASIEGSFDKDAKQITFTSSIRQMAVTFTGTIEGEAISGTWTAGDIAGTWTAKRTSKDAGDESTNAKDSKDDSKKDEAKEVKIDFEGIERRAMQLPLPPGSFGQVVVADGEKLVFRRNSTRGSGDAGAINIFDWAGDEPSEKKVTDGGGFQITPDGKKLLVYRGGKNLAIVDASAGGGKAQTVPTSGMRMSIAPREEWQQIFTDAWRIMRDYFYEPTMHGVDWPKMREHYGKMVDDAASREDVNWIISEMISELNIGHAYLGNPGDVESGPSVGVGLLGCDYELVDGAYRIRKIYEGGPWDADARGPLSQPGVDVKEGDYLLEVDGVPLDTSKDPWAAFIGTSGRVVQLTVAKVPHLRGTGADAPRRVLVKPIGSEVNLRYRAWIERNRKYVEEKSGGQVGYIYVPNTGVDGQDNLFRQFFGQRHLPALIIDERWNGGGQIPTRFIELLNRPVTNYWARRDGIDWTWPPDSHQGHKAMLVNGLAGSGGDMFPWLFKFNNLGPVVGTRTWGGLVGISGNPAMIDGGSITAPTFGFYEKDGTWGVEGHGTDPTHEVIDDPALMWNPPGEGPIPAAVKDPQLDKAIELMQQAVRERPYVKPARPTSPNRAGMGLDPRDK